MKRPLAALIVLLVVSACGGGASTNSSDTLPPVGGPTASEQLATDLAGLSLTDFYDEAFKARSEVLKAREDAAEAGCGVFLLTGVPIEQWPRSND